MCNICDKFSKNMLKKNKGNALPINWSPKMKQRIIGDYVKIKQEYHKQLVKNMRLYEAGAISRDDYLFGQKNAMKLAYTEAYANGKIFGQGHYNGVDETERRFIAFQVNKEMEYMTKFADDIASGSGRMPYLRRMSMYSDSLDSMFGFGRLVYMPEDSKILWQMGDTDKHCIDCIVYSSKNPYTKKTLPGFPKSGSTQCLSNCKCSLLYLYAHNNSTSDYDSFIVKNYTNKANLPSEDQFHHMMELRSQYYYSYGMYVVTGDKKYFNDSLSIKRQFSNYKQTYGLHFPESFPVKTLVKDIKAFNLNSNFEIVKSASGLKSGTVVSFFSSDKQIYGKIVGTYDKFVRVRAIDKSELILDPSSVIMFREL